MNKSLQNPTPNHPHCDESAKAKLTEYFYSNMISVSGAALFLLGGGIFIAFYASIGYMPDFDLISSVTLIAAATTTVIIIVMSLVIMLIFPGTIWNGPWGIEPHLSNSWRKAQGNAHLKGLFLWIGFPMLTGIATLALSLFFGWYPLRISGVIFLVFYYFHIKNKTTLGLRGRLKRLALFFLLTSVSSLLIWLPLWFVFNLYLQTNSDFIVPVWLAAFTSALFVIIANILAAAPPDDIRIIYWYLWLGVVTLFVILVLFGGFHRIPATIMQLYKFGNITTSEVVFNPEGCAILSALGTEVENKRTGLCTAKNILILSRLGRETYLQHKNGSGALKFTIASSDLVSWSLLENHDPSSEASPK